MCRLFLVYSRSAKLAEITTVALTMHSYAAGNRDGFFAMCTSDFGSYAKVIRTLDFNKYIGTLVRWWHNKKLKVAYCHLRLASAGSISAKNVHGFKVTVHGKRYRLAMNGHYGGYSKHALEYYFSYYSNYSARNSKYISEFEKDEKSDTAILAEYINKCQDVVEGFKKFIKEFRHGHGTTFIVAEDFSDMYIIVDGHTCYVYKLVFERPEKNIVYVLTSMSDIVEKLIDRKRVVVKIPERNVRDKEHVNAVITFDMLFMNCNAVKIKEYRYRVRRVYYGMIYDGIYHVDFVNRRFDTIVGFKTSSTFKSELDPENLI